MELDRHHYLKKLKKVKNIEFEERKDLVNMISFQAKEHFGKILGLTSPWSLEMLRDCLKEMRKSSFWDYYYKTKE